MNVNLPLTLLETIRLLVHVAYRPKSPQPLDYA